MHVIEEIIKPYIEYEYEARYVRIGLRPHVARELLKFNTLNRPVNHSAVEEWAAAMRERAWVDATRGLLTFHDHLPDGRPYEIDGVQQPYMGDGQHRTLAVTLLPPNAVVQIGLQWSAPPEARFAVDRGRVRRGSDILSFEGVPHAHDLEAIARKLINHDRQFAYTTKIPAHQLRQFLRENVAMLEGGRKSASMVTSRMRAAPSILGLCFVLMQREDPSGQFVQQFATLLAEGSTARDAVHLIRDRLLQGGPVGGKADRPEDQVELIMRAWRAWRKGERLTKLQLGHRPVAPAPKRAMT